jgi:hypothetical protein
MPQALDPDQHRERMYRLTTRWIEKLEASAEHASVEDLGDSLKLLGEIMLKFEKDQHSEQTSAGATVRKYQTTFKGDGASRGKVRPGPAGDDAAGAPWDGAPDESA